MKEKTMNAYEKFQKVLDEYSHYGARDTEPRWEVSDMVRDAFNGEKNIPNGAREWQLYTAKEGSEEAAEKITEAAKELVDYIFNIPIGKVQEEKKKASAWIDF